MNNTLLAILLIIVVGIVGWLAYSQGYFEGTEAEEQDGIELQIGGETAE